LTTSVPQVEIGGLGPRAGGGGDPEVLRSGSGCGRAEQGYTDEVELEELAEATSFSVVAVREYEAAVARS